MNDHFDILLETECGALLGRQQEGLRIFHAIPYAAAPVGALRFAPPAAAPAWEGTRQAVQPGPIAPQLPSRLSLAMGDFNLPQDEDCLTLTVWAPAVPAAPRPVLVWFHGGGYISGAGGLPWYDGSRLAREGDAVVVNVNYRIGALGFLYSPGISPGNLGLLDQQAALEWVRRNIGLFGGDPENVTLMGQSAGSHSIALLLARQGNGKVPARRAIMQSAPLGLVLHQPEQAARIGEVFIRALGIDPGASNARELACAAPTKSILEAQMAAFRFVVAGGKPGDPASLPFIPMADGVVVPSASALPAALRLAASKLDVLIGTTREEASVFYYGVDAVKNLERAPIPENDIARLSACRPGASAAQLLMDYAGEKLFLDPTLEWATHATEAGRQVYLYQFDWPSPNSELASCHCLELPFVFGTRDAFVDAPMLAGADLQQLDAISAMMRASWLGFAHNGNPNNASTPPWPQFERVRRTTMRFDAVSGAVGDLASKAWTAKSIEEYGDAR